MGRPKPEDTTNAYERRECSEQTARNISGGKASKKQPGEVKYDICGCCLAGVVVYPESIGDLLNSNCHKAFMENFEMFLRKQKDKNRGIEMKFTFKHEQRLDFASMLARIGENYSCSECPYNSASEIEKLGSCLLSTAGKKFFVHPDLKWPDDLLEGFDEAEALISHLKDLAFDPGLQDFKNLSNESVKAVKKDLVVSGYNFVIEQLDAALAEFKEFRDGLKENERGKWDTLVVQQSVKYIEIKKTIPPPVRRRIELHKEMDDIIARYNYKNEDIDSLVEFIEGNSLGAVPKKKEKISRSRKKNNPVGNKHAEIEKEGNIITPQSQERLVQFKIDGSSIKIGNLKPNEKLTQVEKDDSTIENPFEEKFSDEIISETRGEKIEPTREHLEKIADKLVSTDEQKELTVLKSGDKKDALMNKLESIQKGRMTNSVLGNDVENSKYQIDEVQKDSVLNGQNLFNEVKKGCKRDKVSKPNCALVSCRNKGRHKCSRCKAVFYCAQDCLNEDWPHHKMFCDYVFEANKVPDVSISKKSSEIENSGGREEVE